MPIDAGQVKLTDYERGFIAGTLEDALTPYGMDFEPGRAARLIEARLSVLLAARGERGYHEGWTARSGRDDDFMQGTVCAICKQPATWSSVTETADGTPEFGKQRRDVPLAVTETWQPCGHSRRTEQ